MKLLYAGLVAEIVPPNPVVPKNTPAGVRIVVRAGGEELSESEAIRFFEGPFVIEGEISGPALRSARTLRSDASSFVLPFPALEIAGDYSLSNVRILVDGKSVLDASPSRVVVDVIEQVLVTSVKTKPLTLDELIERGVVFDGDDVVGFEFTLAMALESKPIHISFPVAFDREGVPVPQPLSPPLDPTRTGVDVDLPPLPTFVPVMLETADGGEPPEIELPGGDSEPVRIPSVLVIPGDIGFLKQFFSAQLFVANGAPGGSGLVVREIQAAIDLPTDDSLSLPELTTGLQAATLPILGEGGNESLDPGEQGQAEFLIRGEKEGFHTLAFDIDAVLDGLAGGEVALRGRASGGVLVRKPFFDLTFAVPSVVRTDEEFELFVTVHNIGQGIANRIDVSFDHRALSGLELVAGAPASQRIETLQPGELATLAYNFKALRTGQVVASYLRFDGESAVDGSVHFTLGVADGVPLSPDTLVLPASVDALEPSIVRAAMRVLGQAWSIAKAPAGTLAPGIRRIRGSVVIEKALLLAEAGLRVQLGENHDSAVRGLLFDFYGGSPQDPGFDALLHTMAAGRAFADTLSLALEDAMADAEGATGYERETALLAASGPDFLTFALDSDQVELAGPEGALVLSNDEGLFGILTALTSSPYTFALASEEVISTRISVTLPRGDGTFLRGSVTVDLAATDEAQLVVDLFRPEDLEVEIDTDGDGVFETTLPLATESIESEGPRLVSATLIGPEVYEGASAFGFHAAALFDRIVEPVTASEPARYLIPENTVKGAKRQLSGRVVFLTLDRPEGPYESTTLEALSIADLRGADRTARVDFTSLLANPGAVVTGRVFEAGGSPASGGAIAYANFRASADCTAGEELVFAEVPLEPDGSYELRYVRRDPCGAPFRILYRHPTGDLSDVNGFVRAPGERIRLDLALFGRGAVTGRVFENGVPAPGAKVVVTSGTSTQSGGVAETDGDGRYVVHDIVVGPVSVSAARGIAIGANSGRIARAGTTAVVDVVLDPGKIRVRGTISKLEAGVVTPLAGAQVVYALEVPGSSDPIPVGVTRSAADGSYLLEDLPFGKFELSATLDAEARASFRGTTIPGEDRVENLVIAVAPPAELGTVRGRVILPGGGGVSGAIVGVGARQVVAGADGAFEIPGVPVHPGVAEVVHATTSDGKRRGQASVLIGFPGQIVENLVITLSGLGSIELTVFAQNGQPAARQVVGLLGSCPNLCGCRSALTNDLGVATFSELPPGTHFAKAVLVGAGFIDVATGSARIESDGDEGKGVLRFEGVGNVTGKVFLPGGIEPAPGSDVTLTSQIFDRDACELKRGVSHRGRTGANGAFAFANVHFGEVSATASHPFADTKVGAMSVLTKATPLDFELVLVDSTAGIVSGTVFLPDGITPAGGGVEVAAVGPLPEVSVRTGDDGTYEFRPIFPQGMYTFTVTDPITGFAAREQIFLRAGADTEHGFRLKGKGTVRVRVVEAAGAPIETAYVKLSESEFPLNTYEAVLSPASQGVATFSNVFEGPFSVEAKDVFGRDGGRVPSVLPNAGSEIDLEVRLNAVGKVKGRFVMPDGSPIPFGVVTLVSGGQALGRVTTDGSGDVGQVGTFVFDYVPVGALRLEAQDPLTARHGFATGELRAQDETLVLDVRAQGLGRVEGTILANGLPQAAASVELVSGTFRASTSADDLGFYFIEGVPEGRVVATASLGNGFLAGKSEAVLAGEGSTLVLDVALRDSSTVTGRVTKAGSSDPAPPSIVTLSGLSTTTDPLDGSFRFERVPAGSATVDVSVLGNIDRARRFVDLPAGGLVDLTIPLNGVGAIQVQATGAGKLTLRGIGDFPYSFGATLGDDGSFFLPEVLAGPVTATFEVAGPPKLFGTASGLVRPGETLTLPIAIEPTGRVRGLVRRADLAPAAGANVLFLLSAGRGVLSTQTEDDGTFDVEGIPLGSFDLRVEDPFTGGVGFANDLEISFEGEFLDGLVIDLDDSPVRVLTVDPPDGALDVPTNQVVRITFSDPVAALNGAFRIPGVSLAPALAPDGLSATLTGVLPDSKILTVEVTTSFVDIFGRRPVAPFTSTFRTVDLSPPMAVSTFPADGAFEVPAASVISVSFDEPLSDATDFAGLLSIVGPGGPVAGTSERVSPVGARFTPQTPLADNALYQIVVTGAVDELGNTQTTPSTVARFATHDTVAPVLNLVSPAASSWISNPRPAVQVSVADNASGVAPSTAMMKLDGVTVPAVVIGNSIVFTPQSALSEDAHPLEAAIADRAGNLGGFSGSFSVDVTPPSAAEIASPAAGTTLAGVVRFRAEASDLPSQASGVARIDLLANGSLFTSLPGPSFEKDFDTSAILEGDALLTARAVDRAGNAGPEGAPVPVKVDNRKITVSFFTPAPNLRVRDSVDVWVTVSEAVQRVEFEIGGLKVVDTTVPYQATLDLTTVSEGPQPILATAFGIADTGSASRVIVIDRTPPTPPDPDLVFAEPPQAGASLVHGLPGAVEARAVVAVANLDTDATAITSAGVDGAFSLSLAAAIGDLVSLTAEDDLGNRSASTLTVVRSIPSLPPSEDAARLRFDGVVADRVGLDALAPDGELDAVFTVMLSLGEGVTRRLDHIDLEGPMLRSTRTAAGGVLGVASSPGGPFLNHPDGEVSFDVTGSASLILIAADLGFVVEGETYTATLIFTDGARLVGSVTIVPEADARGVPHSLNISASPEAVVVPAGLEGLTTLTIENIRDIEGTPVPDGARVALAVDDMATLNPFGNPVRSAGGRIEGGEPAANNPSFRVFTVSGGSVVALYASAAVTPASITGALAVVQALAADSSGNVLGSETIGTLDLNLRAEADRALVFPAAASLYGDEAPRRTNLRIEVKDVFGSPAADGTRVVVMACDGFFAGVCNEPTSGIILGSPFANPDPTRPVFEVQGGEVTAQYEIPSTAVNPGAVIFATIRVLPQGSQQILGTATLSLIGAGGAEIDLSPSSVPLVFPERSATVRVRHVHDARGNLVPEDAKLLLSAVLCATRFGAGNTCSPSDGGAIVDGAVANNPNFRVFTLTNGAIHATYEARDVFLPQTPFVVKSAGIQLGMGDFATNLVTQTRIAFRALPLVPPSHSIGTAEPPSLFSDRALRTATVTFAPVLDAFGNPLPSGARVAASTRPNQWRRDGVPIPSVFDVSILNGEIQSNGVYSLLDVDDGEVTVLIGSTAASGVGAIQTANVMLLPVSATGTIVGSEVIGVVPVSLPGLTSATAQASPSVMEADGSDRRSVITVSSLRDTLGNPVPEGIEIGLSASFCAARVGGACINPDVAASIVGGEAIPSSLLRAFLVSGGQVVAELSTSGITVASGSRTAIVQVASLRPDRTQIGIEAVATVEVELVPPGASRVAAAPLGLFAGGTDSLSSITVSLVGAPDGSQVALTASDCAARTGGGACIASAGGAILGAGTTPGDGEPANGDPRFRLFTVTGGEVKAVYSSEALLAAVAEPKIARVSVVSADGSGNVTSSQALATGEVHLHGTTAATSNGASSVRLAGGAAKVTFAGIRDALGNTVPDGTVVVATAANCGTFSSGTTCNVSVGGTLLDGADSPSGSQFRAYTVTAGSITVTYSTAAASLGTARIQIAPATTDGTLIGTRSLLGGVHPLQVSP